jgi:hypothetical protein
MTKREGHDPLLDDRPELVGHDRPAALPRAQHLQALALDLTLPRVVGRPMDPERPARVGDRRPGSQIEQL